MKKHTISTFLTLLLSVVLLHAQSLFDQFSEQEVLDITLQTHLNDLRDSEKNKAYMPAFFSYTDTDGRPQQFEIKVKARGKYRRMVCDFPPLKLNFDKDELRARKLADFDKFKLVTHCLDKERAAEDNVLSEYLAYKLYQTLTDQSYRVQLVRITYKDLKNRESSQTRWGFLIEPTAELTARIGGVECEDCFGLTKEALMSENNIRLHLFQYLIGNEDWAIDKLRNVKLFLFPGSDKLVAVPYDFDFAGLVDTHYAVPRRDLDLYDIMERAYLGALPAKSELAGMYRSFEEKRPSMEALVQTFPWLREGQRKHIRKYVAKFFEKEYPRLYKQAPNGARTSREKPTAAFGASGQ